MEIYVFGLVDVFLPKNPVRNELYVDEIKRLEPSTEDVQRIYFIRHGQSILNIPDEKGVLYTQGKSHEVPLTKKGMEQAENLRRRLEDKIDLSQIEIVSSTALRAQQTASIFLKGSKLDSLRTFEGLCELGSGKWEGKPKDESYLRDFKTWQNLSAKDKYFAPKVSTGESYDEVARRAMSDLSFISHTFKHKTIFVFSHNMAMNALAIRWSNTPLSEKPGEDLPDLNLDNCDLLMVELRKGDPVENARVKGVIHSKEGVATLGVRRFWGLFWPVFAIPSKSKL
jgi:broad specificity phosphatase PhoE